MTRPTLKAQSDAVTAAARVISGAAMNPKPSERAYLVAQLSEAAQTLARFYRHERAIRAALGPRFDEDAG